ncbi:MAG TPA: hypothetical protein IAA75_00780 [Candidatus Pullichristensenella avicola]|nr:hypothetical protein [Candidatus Pullichristensenella avicola]
MTLETLEIRFQAEIQGAVLQLRALIGEMQRVNVAASSMRQAGLQLSAGLAAGIRAGKSQVLSAASEVANAAASRIRSALRIHSPSRVARDLGARFSEGFALGVLDGQARAALSAGELAQTAGGAVSAAPMPKAQDGELIAAIERALGTLTVVAPIQVDGVRLGEAAISGINAVRRATGRQMLEI